MARSTALPAKVRRGTTAPAFPALYGLLRTALRPALARLFDLRIDGLEHLPAEGPYVIAANHHNYLDGVVLALAVPQPIAFLVMPRVYRATPLHPLFHDHIGSIPISVERPDVGALRRALGLLGRGRVVGIFPEGPFSVRGRLERGLPGVGLLALHSGVPVVPAGIRGTYEALLGRRFYLPRAHPVTVRFGLPRRFAFSEARGPVRDLHGAVRDAYGVAVARGLGARRQRAHVTQRVMDDIATLLA